MGADRPKWINEAIARQDAQTALFKRVASRTKAVGFAPDQLDGVQKIATIAGRPVHEEITPGGPTRRIVDRVSLVLDHTGDLSVIPQGGTLRVGVEATIQRLGSIDPGLSSKALEVVREKRQKRRDSKGK